MAAFFVARMLPVRGACRQHVFLIAGAVALVSAYDGGVKTEPFPETLRKAGLAGITRVSGNSPDGLISGVQQAQGVEHAGITENFPVGGSFRSQMPPQCGRALAEGFHNILFRPGRAGIGFEQITQP